MPEEAWIPFHDGCADLLGGDPKGIVARLRLTSLRRERG